MMIVTIYALFFDDIRIIFLPKSADFTCDIVTLVCIVLYFAELILGSVAIEGYFLSFFFWLDLLMIRSGLTRLLRVFWRFSLAHLFK